MASIRFLVAADTATGSWLLVEAGAAGILVESRAGGSKDAPGATPLDPGADALGVPTGRSLTPHLGEVA